jgi:hypothetical protein
VYDTVASKFQSSQTIHGTIVHVLHPGGTETHVVLKSDGNTEQVCLGDSHFLKSRNSELAIWGEFRNEERENLVQETGKHLEQCPD